MGSQVGLLTVITKRAHPTTSTAAGPVILTAATIKTTTSGAVNYRGKSSCEYRITRSASCMTITEETHLSTSSEADSGIHAGIIIRSPAQFPLDNLHVSILWLQAGWNHCKINYLIPCWLHRELYKSPNHHRCYIYVSVWKGIIRRGPV